MQIIDISLPLSASIPVWPDSVGFTLSRISSLDAGDPVTVSRIDLDVHTGTHIDAPAHFVEGGGLVEDLALTDLVGPCLVVEVPDVEFIDVARLQRLKVPSDTRRLLFRTRNSDLWTRGVGEFRADYVALTADAARWVVDHEISLVGIDYLSIQRFTDDPSTHEILLHHGVVILEGLDLSGVRGGSYFLVCLPLRLSNAEAAPVRAVLLNPAP